MKNETYNLIKSLHRRLKDVWLIDKHFAKDTKCVKCKKLYTEMKKDFKGHMDKLEAELKNHL